MLGSTERKRVGYEDRYPFVHQAFVGRPSYRRLGRPSDMMPQEGIPTTYKGRKEGKNEIYLAKERMRSIFIYIVYSGRRLIEDPENCEDPTHPSKIGGLGPTPRVLQRRDQATQSVWKNCWNNLSGEPNPLKVIVRTRLFHFDRR